MEMQIKMVSAASEVFSFKKRNSKAIHEEIFQHISDYIKNQKIKDYKTKLAMIAAAGKASEISNKNPDSSEKELLKEFMQEIPAVLENMEYNY